MKRILHLISSVTGKESKSLKLGNAVVEKILAKYPGSSVEELNLTEMEIPHLTPQVLRTFFIPPDQLNDEEKKTLQFSDRAVKQLLDSDILIIGAPLYNFSIPSSLKSWFDHIVRAGITFSYSDQGPVGKVAGKKVYIAMSSGGVYSEGEGKARDFVVPYLTTICWFLGMKDLTAFRVEGLKIPGIMEHAMQKAIDSIVID